MQWRVWNFEDSTYTALRSSAETLESSAATGGGLRNYLPVILTRHRPLRDVTGPVPAPDVAPAGHWSPPYAD